MDLDILKTLGQVAGIGGVALGVLLLLFREVVRKNVFPHLDRAAGYRLLRLVLVLTWSVALVGIGAWVYIKNGSAAEAGGAAPIRDYTVAGLVTDADNNAIAGAQVFVVGNDEPVETNESGAFRMRLKAPENSVVVARVSKAGYKSRMQNVTLPSSGLIVTLDRAAAAAAAPPESVDTGRTAPTTPAAIQTSADAPSPTSGRIYLQYGGDLYACVLQIKVRLGSKDVTPSGSLFPVENVPLGGTTYAISGTIGCPTAGVCSAEGSGRLTLEDEQHYNVVWQNTSYGRCDVRLIPGF